MCLFNKKSFFIKNLTDCTKFAKYCMPSSGAISFKIQLITKYTRAPFSKMIVTRRLVWNFQLLWSSSFMYFVTPCRNNAHLIKLKSQFMKVINIKLKFMGSQGCPNPSDKIEWSSHWSRSSRFYNGVDTMAWTISYRQRWIWKCYLQQYISYDQECQINCHSHCETLVLETDIKSYSLILPSMQTAL